MKEGTDGMASLFDKSKKLIFVGGKGGVGKSSSASAIAYHLSKKFNTLLISTDPAHSVGDSLLKDVDSKSTSLNLDGHQLYAKELDASLAFNAFKEKHEQEIRLLFDTSTHFDHEDIDQMMSLMIPGIDEVMGLKSIVDTLKEETHEKVIVDTAPTGHALRLLFMPKILNTWIKTMAAMRWKYRLVQKTFKGKYTPDEADDLLMDLKRTVSRMNAILTDSTQCEFILVTIPNEMALSETVRLQEQLKENNIHVNSLIINHVAPDSSDSFYQEWRHNQQQTLEKVKQKFPHLHQVEIPLFAHEIQGMDHIRQFEHVLFKHLN